MKTLYADCDTETYKRICNVADSKDLTDKQKLLIITEEFKNMRKKFLKVLVQT